MLIFKYTRVIGKNNIRYYNTLDCISKSSSLLIHYIVKVSKPKSCVYYYKILVELAILYKYIHICIRTIIANNSQRYIIYIEKEELIIRPLF